MPKLSAKLEIRALEEEVHEVRMEMFLLKILMNKYCKSTEGLSVEKYKYARSRLKTLKVYLDAKECVAAHLVEKDLENLKDDTCL